MKAEALRTESISVIVPVYRQWDCFETFLHHWAQLDISHGVEVELVCVDNEPGSCPEDLRLPPEARLVPCARPGAYAARNAGAEAACGSWFIFTDADCRPQPGWLEAFRAAAVANPESLLAGDVRMMLEEPASDWAKFDLVRGIPQRRYVSRGYAVTANLAASGELFSKMGGFDAQRLSGGDAEFCRRARERYETRLRFVSEAAVVHPARADWDSLRTKARRVKGGQLTNGPVLRRLYWMVRTCLPPLHELVFYLRAQHPVSTRLVACRVRMRLWGVELREMMRLLSRRSLPERR